MAVSSIVNKMSPYACGDDRVNFNFSFPIFAQGDLEVWLTDSDGVETKLTLTEHYSIAATNNDYANGGIVTTEEAYADGNTITLVRVLDLTQGVDYQENDNFPAETHERALDRAMMIAQQLKENITRNLVVPITDEVTSLEIPTKAARASKFLAFDADSKPIPSVGSAVAVSPFMAEVNDDLTAAAAAATLEVYTKTEEQALIKTIYENSKQLGELFYLDSYKAPSEWDFANPDAHFAGLCLDDGDHDIDIVNWPKFVVERRTLKATYNEAIGGEKTAFDVTDWDIATNVVTLTFDNPPAELAMLAALAEDNLVHNDAYNNWRSITLASAIGDVDAGEYAITEVDPTARTIKFAFTHANGSDSGTWTVEFYKHRIPGSSTTARVFERPGGVLVAANDGDGECIAGMRRRDRGQGHWHVLGNAAGNSMDAKPSRVSTPTDTSVSEAGTGSGRLVSTAISIISDPFNGTPRIGKTTDPRAIVGHLYIWGKEFKETA